LSLAYYPHSAAVQAFTEATAGQGYTEEPSFQQSSTIACQITPLDDPRQMAAYGVDYGEAMLMLCDDSVDIKENYKVTYDSRAFIVARVPEMYKGIDICDHKAAILVRLR